MGRWFSVHTHSHFSVLDAMTDVPGIVAKASQLGYPALGMQDHGNMAGTVRLYKSAKEFGMKPYPGIETYLIDPHFDGKLEESGKVGRYHLGLLALDLKGYQALVRFTSKTHTRPRFNRFPRCTIGDLAELGNEAGKHIVLTTGCFFGLVQQTIVNDSEKEAAKIVKMLATWFPNTFVELQHHNIKHDENPDAAIMTDDDMVDSLMSIADYAGLPIIATQDSHYTDQGEKKAHALMKRMVYGGVEDEFPGDSFHLASEEWVASHYTDEVWDKVLEGCDHLLDLHDLKIPPLDDFKPRVPKVLGDDEDADVILWEKCVKFLKRYLRRMGMEDESKKYKKRLKKECEVIFELDMSEFFLLMLQCIEWGRRKGFAMEARGSANGSLVCFLLMITQVDPLIWGGLFERFLSRDRIKPPDIDMDIEDAARPEMLAYIDKQFESMQIGNWAELGARAIDDKGSVLEAYKTYLRRKCIDDAWKFEQAKAERQDRKPVKGEAEKWGRINFAKEYGDIETLEDIRKISPADYVGLKRMAAMKSVRKSYGTHASGVLLSAPGMSIYDWIPTMLVASSNTTVTQYDMDDVEEFGFLKADWLGQKTLRIMRRCQELILESSDGRKAAPGLSHSNDATDFTWIPEDDKDACKILREGRTDNGIFHFEGYTKAKGGKEMGIKSTKDAVFATALFMPGAMESGQKDLYVQRRKSAAARKATTYLHPIFEKHLSETYGAVIFQEQPLAVLRDMGMSIESINKMFKVVKDSGKGAVERNRGRLNELRKEFDQHAKEVGMWDVRDEAWQLVTGFMNYGFNRAHSSGYGIRSYRCAYLKAHHPLEYMTAVLEVWAGQPKEKIYAREARRIGIRLTPPDINISGATWTMDKGRGVIRRGLTSIAGVGKAAAEELARNAPYKNLDEVAKRCNPRQVTGGKAWLAEGSIIGTLRKLDDVGALESIK